MKKINSTINKLTDEGKVTVVKHNFNEIYKKEILQPYINQYNF
jgi:hypothetical protein